MTDLRKQIDDLRAWIAAAEARRDALQKDNDRLRAVLALLKSDAMDFLEPGSWGIKCIVDHNAIIDEALKK